MSNKRIQNLLALGPLTCLLVMYFINWKVTNTDALTYHFYYARVITEKNLNFFSNRPIPLLNELGFGLSAYYPWLYSHLVAFIHNLLEVNYDKSVLILSAILYLTLLYQYGKSSSRLLIATYLMLPFLYENFFNAGTNYFLTSLLGYSLFNIVSRKVSYVQLIGNLIISFLIINTHVFGLYICGAVYLYGFRSTKNYTYLYIFLCAIIYQFTHNFILTGSITFPFLIEFFPTKTFNKEEWNIVENQIREGLIYEFFNTGLKSYLFLGISFAFLLYVITRDFISKHEKMLLIIVLLPSLLAYWLGFRHRIIFFSCFIFILTKIFEIKNISLITEFKSIWFFIKGKIYLFVFGIIFLISIKNILNTYNEQTGKKISINIVKSCFYNTISDLSIDNKILFTETELMRIANPENILSVDGKNNTDISSLHSVHDFVNYLKLNNIKYITHTPLSTVELEFSLKSSYSKFVDKLINQGEVKLYKDCVTDNHYDNKIMPTYQDKILRNWLIYEVK